MQDQRDLFEVCSWNWNQPLNTPRRERRPNDLVSAYEPCDTDVMSMPEYGQNDG